MGGLCLGIASIFAFWSVIVSNKALSEVFLVAGFLIALMLLTPVLIKFFCHPSLFIQDIKNTRNSLKNWLPILGKFRTCYREEVLAFGIYYQATNCIECH